MPTIDQLAPATAASDTDEFMVSQSGIARSITRAQLLAGIQPQLSIASGALLGGPSTGTGSPEQIAVGANLTLVLGTLSATASPYVMSALPAGIVPAATDSVPIAQTGYNVVVTYAQFVSGLPGVANVDGSQLLITAAGSTAQQRLADFAANTLPKAGGTLTGWLGLAGDPTTALQAATKEYVDARVFRLGDTMTGPLILSGDPTTALEATTKEYTDGQFAKSLPAAGGTMTGPLTLAANPTSTLQAAPRQYVDDQVATALPLTGGSLSGALLLAGNPSGMMQAATKQYVDFQFATALPLSGGTLTGPVSIDNTISFSGASSFQSSVSMSAGLTISSGTLVAEGSASIAGSLSVGGGTIGLPTYAVAALPLCTVGALAYATNGRKIGEAAGVGTGVLVAGGSVGQWISVMSGTAVLA